MRHHARLKSCFFITLINLGWGTWVKARGQPGGVSSLLAPCGSWAMGIIYRLPGLVASTLYLLSHFASPRCRCIFGSCLVCCCMTLITALDLCQFEVSQIYVLNSSPARATFYFFLRWGFPVWSWLSSNLEIFLPLCLPSAGVNVTFVSGKKNRGLG